MTFADNFRTWRVTKEPAAPSSIEAASVAFKTVSKGRPTNDHQHPYRARRFRRRPFAWAGTRACRIRAGQNGQGRRHEKGHDVQGFHEERYDVQGRHEEGRRDVEGWHEERRRNEEVRIVCSSACRPATLAGL